MNAFFPALSSVLLIILMLGLIRPEFIGRLIRKKLSRIKVLLFFGIPTLLSIIVFGSSILGITIHNQRDAANLATKFAQLTLMENNFQEAYGMTTDQFQQSFDFETFKDMVQTILVTKGPLTEVQATESEVSEGNKIYIDLVGSNSDGEKLFYRFLLEGNAIWGYKVASFWKLNAPMPPSESRQHI